MSFTDLNMSATRGKKVASKPGRFDPSEPLHMTTRRAAKSVTTNGSPSINGSLDGDDSRRGSFDDSRPVTAHSNASQGSIKSRRLSDASLPPIPREITTNGLLSSDDRLNGDSSLAPLSPTLLTPSPSRKRKRSTSPVNGSSIELTQPASILDDSNIPLGVAVDASAINEGDAIEVVPAEDLSDREESRTSSRTDDDDVQPDYADMQSVDFTPAVSNPISPPTRTSDSDENLPHAQTLEAALQDVVQAAEEEAADAGDDMDIDVDAQDIDEGGEADGVGRPVRRFGGRRRAMHPIPKVEKALARQAELKSSYRAIARMQKVVLAEIAQRTIDGLESDPLMHSQATEYSYVKKGLDEALEERQYRVRYQVDSNMEQLKQKLEATSLMRKATCVQNFNDLKELRLAQIEHEMLRIARAVQMEAGNGEYETEDEDDVLPKPKRTCYRFKKPSKTLDDVYFSRTRELMETERATDDLTARFEVRNMLDELNEDERPAKAKGFTVMDERAGKAAKVRREGVDNTALLAKAATEVEKATEIPVIRNEDARGLQLLGDLASRPSIAISTQASTKLGPYPGSRRPSSRPMPPHLQIQTHYRPAPITVEMSPRTSQALGDRFESSMLPPATPRSRGNPVRPVESQPEAMLPSPRVSITRISSSQPPSATASDGRPEPSRNSMWDIDRGSLGPRPPSAPKPGAQFSPPQPNDRRMDFSLWRDLGRGPPAEAHRRSSSHDERPPLTFGMGMPPRDERQYGMEQRKPDAPPPARNGLSVFDPVRPRPSWPERTGQPGAADTRPQEPPLLLFELPPRPTLKAKSPPPRPNSSMMFTMRDFRNTGLEQKGQQRDKPKNPPSTANAMSVFKPKPTKDEREGMSRRSWSHQRKLSKSLGGSGSAGSPILASPASILGRSDGPPRPPVSWPPPPPPVSHSSPPAPAPAAPHLQSPFSQPPAQPSNFRAAPPPFDPFANRPFPPRPASSSHDRLPPTPLYVVSPQATQPQQGAASEHYNRPFAPPPPPGYQPPQAAPQSQPPPPPQTSQPSFPSPAPGGSYASSFGGPPLAPAGANAFHAPGFRPAPAFAQQAQQQQAHHQQQQQQQQAQQAQQGQQGQQGQQQQQPPGFRRRAQSDASFSKFHNWNPPTGRR
ncbi:hypothetical protein BDY17DRAFT_55411 [Neohortaea acidophila]|uniref:Sds3-like-domain-containing protein n=1 Tax=Neohortaea acidophila TaxID=245834 RepID=A0A6A6PFT8_9PEZI|nr:uncharacterized protein BDY17DRAFT_55411 [Neohortaea acidophila]KAF2478626.1 hypothetical protein BDY17DRAFT_55411 [Neohortaea acidophila]